MQLEAKKYLFDMRRAAGLVAEFTAGLSFEDYQQRAIVRAAVERELQIVGEALAQLTKLDAVLAGQISDQRRIITFRNILVHGYADVDDRLVWDVVTTKLPALRAELDVLLPPER
jgi:uncharacterized protein with HEPN domain